MGKLALIITMVIVGGGVYYVLDTGMLDSGTSYDDMSATELKEIAIDWNYKDLNNRVRGSDGLIIYEQKDEGKVIFIEGSVMKAAGTQSIKKDMIIVCTGSIGNCSEMFVEISGDFSYEWADDIRGWVEIRETFDEIKNNPYYEGISAREILLECVDCN